VELPAYNYSYRVAFISALDGNRHPRPPVYASDSTAQPHAHLHYTETSSVIVYFQSTQSIRANRVVSPHSMYRPIYIHRVHEKHPHACFIG